jgi:hypothetical protein
MSRNDTIGTHKTRVHSQAIFDYYKYPEAVRRVHNDQAHCQLRNAVVVTYHNTDVVAISGSDRTGYDVILNTGGYKTATTKLRMNQAMNEYDFPIGVFQKDGAWYVQFNGPNTVPFYFKALLFNIDTNNFIRNIAPVTV